MEVEMKIRGLMMDPVTNMPIVILKDVSGNTVLPIWVGIYEANAIALARSSAPSPKSEFDSAASSVRPHASWQVQSPTYDMSHK